MSELLEIVLKAVDEASSVFAGVNDSVNSMKDSLTGATDTINADFTTMETNVSSFQTAVDSVDSATLDELSSELGLSTDELERLIETGANLGSIPFNEANAEVMEFESSVTDADVAVQGLGNDLGIVNSSMLLQLAEQVGQIGDRAEGMSQEMNSAAITIGQLATQTGIAEPQLKSMITTISNETFPKEEAMMYAKSLDQIGVSSENLGKSATDLDRINDAFGMGAETTNSLAQELSVLGVDMNDVSSSFNALAYANANTVGGMQNYYAFLRKYDSQFKELGFNVDQSSMIIAAATQKYGGGRAALSGLSSALEECNGDTQALEKALGMQAGSLDRATEITGQYEGQLQELANEEMEHKTLTERLGAAWDDIAFSLDGVISPLSSFVGLIGSAGSFALQINGLKTLTDTLKGFNIQQTISNALEGDGVIARAASALGITTEAAAAEGATTAFGGLAIAEGAALWWIIAIVAAIAALVVIVYEVGKAFGWWDDFGGMIDAIWAGIQRLWNAFINHPDVQAFIAALNDAWSGLVAAIQPVISAVADFFNINTSGNFDVVRALIDAIGFAWNAITTPLRTVITLLLTVISVFSQLINGQMSLQQAIYTIWITIQAQWGAILNKIKALLVRMFGQYVNTATARTKSLVNNAVNWLKKLPSRALSALVGVVKSITTAGGRWIKNAERQAGKVVSGVYNKLTEVPSKVSSALTGVVDAISKPFKDAYNEAKKWWDKVSNLGGGNAAGGEEAYLEDFLLLLEQKGLDIDSLMGGNAEISTVNEETYSVEDRDLNVEITEKIVLDLENIPRNISENELMTWLKSAIGDKGLLKLLVENKDFQQLDEKMKQRLLKQSNRSLGV